MTVTTNTIAELGALIGDPGRANMLIALLDGRALTARELADRAGVTPQTASRHLGKLLEAGLLRMERQGRRHYHRLATPDVARMLEAMHVAAAGSMTASHPARTGTADPHMREARSCYDHLAGRIAVELAATLTAASDEGALSLTSDGGRRLAAWGVDVPTLRAGRRVFCRACLDWSERRPHIAGALGAAMLDRALGLGWLRRRQGSRSLEVTAAGVLGLRERFDLRAPAEQAVTRTYPVGATSDHDRTEAVSP